MTRMFQKDPNQEGRPEGHTAYILYGLGYVFEGTVRNDAPIDPHVFDLVLEDMPGRG